MIPTSTNESQTLLQNHSMRKLKRLELSVEVLEM